MRQERSPAPERRSFKQSPCLQRGIRWAAILLDAPHHQNGKALKPFESDALKFYAFLRKRLVCAEALAARHHDTLTFQFAIVITAAVLSGTHDAGRQVCIADVAALMMPIFQIDVHQVSAIEEALDTTLPILEEFLHKGRSHRDPRRTHLGKALHGLQSRPRRMDA